MLLRMGSSGWQGVHGIRAQSSWSYGNEGSVSASFGSSAVLVLSSAFACFSSFTVFGLFRRMGNSSCSTASEARFRPCGLVLMERQEAGLGGVRWGEDMMAA